VVLGEADLDAIAAAGDVLATGIAGATRVVIPDADHLVPTRRPEAFNRVALEFLERVGA
jgi:pimeloyl-ACP methyl ester carboxylesterase